MVEGARLESVFRGNPNEGSNPSLTATHSQSISLVASPPDKSRLVLDYSPSNSPKPLSKSSKNPAFAGLLGCRSPRVRDKGEFPDIREIYRETHAF